MRGHAPTVVQPYTRLHPEAVQALTGWDVAFVDVSGSDESYWELLASLWAKAQTFVIVEQDVVVRPDTLDALIECHKPWCSFQVPYVGKVYAGLSCAKFSAGLIAKYPDAINRIATVSDADHPPKHWCPTTDTRVLDADTFRWRPVGDVAAGERLMGVDEDCIRGTFRKGRIYLPSVVEAIATTRAEVVRVILEDETSLRVTPDHLFLTTQLAIERNSPRRVRWESARSLTEGRDALTLYLKPADIDPTRDGGYLAGLFDGEGVIGADSQGLCFGQKPGPVLDRGRALIKRFGFDMREQDNGHGVKVIYVQGGLSERLRFLANVRPERLIEKVDPARLGRAQSARKLRVIAVEPAGEADVAQVQTSSDTYLTEGFASHNCRLDSHLQSHVLNPGGEIMHVHGPPLGHLRDEESPESPWAIGPAHGCWQ